MVKIADFGLARDLNSEDDDAYYRQQNNRPMPIKWMSLEAIKEHTFTTKSDVVGGLVLKRLILKSNLLFSNFT